MFHHVMLCTGVDMRPRCKVSASMHVFHRATDQIVSGLRSFPPKGSKLQGLVPEPYVPEVLLNVEVHAQALGVNHFYIYTYIYIYTL